MNSKVKGIIAMLISAVGFSFIPVFFRLVGDLPVFQKSLARNFVAMFIPLFLVYKYRQPTFGELSSQPLLVSRSVLGLIGALPNIYAIDHMVLSDTNILMKLSPLWTIVPSLTFLHEKVRKHRITTMVIAIIGMLLVAKPESSSSAIPSIAGLPSGIFAASAHAYVRALSTHEEPYMIVFYFLLLLVIVLIPFSMLIYTLMTTTQILFLLGARLSAAVGQIGMTLAYSSAPAKNISVFTYVSVIFTALFGFILFERSPDMSTIVGYIVIIGASCYMLDKARRETTTNQNN